MTRILRYAVVVCLSLGFLVAHDDPLFSQATPERVWLAGRYDSASVVVYFEAVKFKGTFPAGAASMAVPIADAFFTPKALPADSLAGFQKERGGERFAVGDLYDLLLDGGRVATITLTTLIGFESDEFVGNDSYIGALGIVAPEDLPFFTKDYYVVQHHQARRAGATRPTRQPVLFASGNEPVSLDVQARVTSLLREHLATGAPTAVRIEMEQTSPFSQRMEPFMRASPTMHAGDFPALHAGLVAA